MHSQALSFSSLSPFSLGHIHTHNAGTSSANFTLLKAAVCCPPGPLGRAAAWPRPACVWGTLPSTRLNGSEGPSLHRLNRKPLLISSQPILRDLDSWDSFGDCSLPRSHSEKWSWFCPLRLWSSDVNELSLLLGYYADRGKGCLSLCSYCH